MEWIKIDRNTELPQEEVLALCEDTIDLLVGYLFLEDDNTVTCVDNLEDAEVEMIKVTHYILTSNLIALPKQ